MNANTNPVKTFLVLGRPGSGKGTQAKLLAEVLGVKPFSSGHALRVMAEEPTLFGQTLKEALASGDLVPEWLVKFLLTRELLSKSPEEVLVFDGICRKPGEAKTFHETLEWLGRPYVVFNIEVPENEVALRLSGRNERLDDAADSIPMRLHKYREDTQRSIDFFSEQGRVITINGSQTPEEVQRDILKALDIVT